MKTNKKSLLNFLIPSIIGIIIFMIPVKFDGEWTIIVKIFADFIAKTIGDYLPALCTIIITISFVMSVLASFNVKFIKENKLLDQTFSVTPVWLVLRILGFIVVWMVVLKDKLNLGPFFDMIVADESATFILNDLLTSLVIIFVIASMLLPLLLDFGLLEFIGAIFTKIMRPVFLIPGRAAVDCITSWIGDGTLGVMLTANQYESGYYSAKEAAIISTNFSAVSITFSLIVLSQVDMVDYFGVYYLLVCLVGIVCAIIVPRIPPLSLKKDDYVVKSNHDNEDIAENYSSSVQYGLDLAIKRAESHKGIGEFLKNGIENAFGMWFSVMPIVMIIGTASLVLANNTQVFEILGKPFLPLLNFLKVPESLEASKTMIVGFSDMFTPSIIAASTIQSQMTKFIVATISVTQLIYLSEVGGLILASSIPVNLFELFVIFIERTIISLLIVAPIAHLLFM
ncbi:YjiH family protein [Finegoldia sp. BIOML-A3]|uniref:YjiH family protein n=1 Tax=unclassified Finegoldia TaxID=2619637 RepID=UPI0012B0153D|nr:MULTISPECIES: YjiH family protein [Finegoldia]MBS5942080.1 YjiH family protein [Finegoldia magna]MSA99316.1 YjiH family protein [Finegoldia sp. BIOML-A3]MSB93319.1 YjiH family protein [Finegoldia sp. BIOML-A4]